MAKVIKRRRETATTTPPHAVTSLAADVAAYANEKLPDDAVLDDDDDAALLGRLRAEVRRRDEMMRALDDLRSRVASSERELISQNGKVLATAEIAFDARNARRAARTSG
jgi:hypothetical protein